MFGSLKLKGGRMLISWATLMLVPTFALAQQPGSGAYNSVYLPAHGVGDTRQSGTSWGAMALADGHQIGWVVDADSENSAADAAMEDCVSAGGSNCVVEFTFSNACAVVATGPKDTTWVHNGSRSMRWIRKEALRDCGSGCQIVREGCAGK